MSTQHPQLLSAPHDPRQLERLYRVAADQPVEPDLMRVMASLLIHVLRVDEASQPNPPEPFTQEKD
jgi:hypothetical protein